MNINDLTLEQLYQLNDMVCQRIDQIRAQQEREAIARIRPGMKVTIEGPDGTIFGIALKLNRKITKKEIKQNLELQTRMEMISIYIRLIL